MCKSEGEPDFPSRLIDLGVAGQPESSVGPYLYITQEQKIRQGRYVCLSYCWGPRPAFTTSSTTLIERKRGIPVESLPRTIKDAIDITRMFGIRFLWVDALCILQGTNKEERLDWERESENMANIYGNAFLTLSAAASSNSEGGIFTVPSKLDFFSCKIPFSATPNEGIVFVTPLPPISPPMMEPINKRGWTVQERVLSRRILVYGTDEMSWQCHGIQIQESGVLLPPMSMSICRFPDILWPGGWWRIIQDYTSRNLTNYMDKLPALSGMARIWQLRTEDRYLAGLWERNLPEDLLWIVHPFLNKSPNSRPPSYRAPSWTWCSIDGTIMYRSARSKRLQTRQYFTNIVSCEVQLSGINAFGCVKSGKLIVCGPLARPSTTIIPCKAKPPVLDLSRTAKSGQPIVYGHQACISSIVISRAWNSYALNLLGIAKDGSEISIGSVDSDLAYHEDPLKEFVRLWWLHIVDDDDVQTGLILTQVDEKGEVFRRVGLFTIRKPWFIDSKEQTITII